MSEWIYFIHPPREDFAATMTAEEEAAWATHFERCQRLLAEGVIVLVGPTLGRLQHRDRDLRGARRGGGAADHGRGPGIAGGFARGELRPFRASLLRGRD